MDDIRDEPNGVGPNTSGWDWHGDASGTSSAASVTPAQAAPAPAQSTSHSPAPSASGMSVSVPGQVPAGVGQDCTSAVNALNSIAGPLEQQDAAGLIAAGNAAKAADVFVEENASVVNPNLVGDAEAVLREVVGMGAAARNYEDSGTPWSDVTARELSLGGNFLNLEGQCILAGVNIDGSTQPAESSAPSSVGCPSSARLVAAWDAAPASARDSWTTLTVTGFFRTQCWRQWVVTNPVMQGNGPVIFTDADGQLALFPETELSEFEADICWVPGAPGRAWGGLAGPVACP